MNTFSLNSASAAIFVGQPFIWNAVWKLLNISSVKFKCQMDTIPIYRWAMILFSCAQVEGEPRSVCVRESAVGEEGEWWWRFHPLGLFFGCVSIDVKVLVRFGTSFFFYPGWSKERENCQYFFSHGTMNTKHILKSKCVQFRRRCVWNVSCGANMWNCLKRERCHAKPKPEFEMNATQATSQQPQQQQQQQ